MANYGIKVVNTFNDVSIDASWVNYSKWYDLSIACPAASWNPGAGGTPTYPRTNIIFPVVLTSIQPPVLFIRHAEFTVGSNNLAECKPLGYPGAWTGFQVAFGGTGTRQMYFRVYAVLPQSLSFGGLVKRSDGSIAFDSGRLPLIVERVVQSAEWTLSYNAAAGTGFREQDWVITRPNQEYVSCSTILYYDGLAGRPTGRVFVQLAADLANPALLRLFALYDSGSSAVNPGAGSRFVILPMLCDGVV